MSAIFASAGAGGALPAITSTRTGEPPVPHDPNDQEITAAASALIEAVAAAGFDRARDALYALEDDLTNGSAPAWHVTLANMLNTAVSVAEHAAGGSGNDRWLGGGDAGGMSVIWAWAGPADAELTARMQSSIQAILAAAPEKGEPQPDPQPDPA